MIRKLEISFDLTPDVTEFSIPEENTLIFVGYIQSTRRKRGGTSKYPSWMALMEAWRCAKRLSEEVHGVLSCPCKIGYPMAFEPTCAHWFNPGPEGNTKEEFAIYLAPTNPQMLQHSIALPTLQKHIKRATRFVCPAVPPAGTPADYAMRACECDYVTSQAREILFPEASAIGSGLTAHQHENPRIQKWMLDSGASHHMVGRDRTRPRDILKGTAPLIVATANGKVRITEIFVPAFDRDILAHVMDKSPELLSVGRLCNDYGLSFLLAAGSQISRVPGSRR